MTAYIIGDVEVENEEGYRDYTSRTPASIAKFGGEFIVRGGNPAELEGGWSPSRVVVLRFPDRASAQAWYDSDDYQPLKALRHKNSTGRLIILDGHDG